MISPSPDFTDDVTPTDVRPGPDRLRLVIAQEVIADYRRPLFEAISGRVDELVVVTGDARASSGAVWRAAPLATVETREVKNLGCRRWTLWQRGLSRAIRDFDPDAVVLPANPRLLSNVRAARWSRDHGIVVAAWGLGQFERPRNLVTRRVSSLALRTLLRQCTVIFAYSRTAERQYERLMRGSPEHRIVWVGNSAVPAAEYRDAFGAPTRAQDEPPRLAFVGRLVQSKRVELLIDAVAQLQADIDPILDVVGEGPMRSALESKAADVGIQDRVRFHGAMSRAEASRVLQRADFAVVPGLGGLVIEHSLTAGTPVIVCGSADGTEDDLIVEGLTGLKADPGDAADLAHRIRHAIATRSTFSAAAMHERLLAIGGVEGVAMRIVHALEAERSGSGRGEAP